MTRDILEEARQDGSPYLVRDLRSLAAVQATRLRFHHHRFAGSISIEVETADEEFLAELRLHIPEEGRAEFTADFSPAMRPHYFPVIHNRTREILREAHAYGINRIWSAVDAGDDKGHRWLRLLGFQPEGLMRQYAKGRDHVLYAKLMNAQATGR